MKSLSEKLRAFWAKLKTKKNIEIIIAVVIIGVALIIYSTVTQKTTQKPTAPPTTTSGHGATGTTTDERLASILSDIAGAGAVSVMITYEADNVTKVQGVMIVAKGASDFKVRSELVTATQTLLGVTARQISVFTMK